MLSRKLEGFSKSNFVKGTHYINKVKHCNSDEDEQYFNVQGSHLYNVILKQDMGDGLYAICSCPAFETMDECKHVAACILYVDQTAFARQFDSHVTYLGSYEIEEEVIEEKHKPRKSANNLSHLLTFLRPNEIRPQESIFPVSNVSAPKMTEMWYELNISFYDSEDSKIRIHFRSRTTLKSGKQGKINERKFKFSELEILQNQDDKEIMRELLPFVRAWPAQRNELQIEAAYLPKENYALLVKMLQTGRCFLNSHSYLGNDVTPVSYEPQSLLEIKLMPNMERLTLALGYFKDGPSLNLSNPREAIFMWNFRLLFYMDKAIPFETYLGQELFTHLRREKVITFTEKDFDEHRDEILGSIDHRAIAGDHFGLPSEEIDTPLEVHLKLPLGLKEVDARLMISMPKQGPPYTTLKIPVRDNYHRIKTEIENLTSRIDEDGFFKIPLENFQQTLAHAIELGVIIKAEKALVKSASDFNMSITHDMKWFAMDGTVTAHGKSYTLPQVLKSLKEGSSFVEFRKGELTYLPQAWLDKVKKISEIAEFQDGKYVVHISRAQQLESLAVPSMDLTSFLNKIRSFKTIRPVSAGKSFRGSLRDYQSFGLNWMNFLRELGLGGCLADDMGLGKTVQVAANLQLRKSEKGRESKTSLVICPKSLVFNWFNELKKFTPDLKVCVHEAGSFSPSLLKSDIVITTYGLLQRNCESFADKNFDYIILDEAQAIKNPRSLTTKAVCTLKGQHRLALTGTPVENHVGELYSIFNFLMPGAYKNQALNPPHHNNTLVKTLKPFILRRTKQQVLKDLPDKVEQLIYCEQTPEEAKHYQELREFIVANLNKKVDITNFKKSSIMVLEALTRLRQASCHPGLINQNLQDIPTGKLEQLSLMLKEILQEGHKVVIFSQFTSLLSLARSKLGFTDKNSVYLDGSSRDREGLVEQFRNDTDKNVFFLSLKAGGTGLNLVEASYCFLLDPWWNPAVEDQAIARLHRMGQKQSVNIYRLITKGSIEEKVLELQKIKRDVVMDVLDDNSEGFIRSLSAKDLEFLLE